jgi:hypothetical protein
MGMDGYGIGNRRPHAAVSSAHPGLLVCLGPGCSSMRLRRPARRSGYVKPMPLADRHPVSRLGTLEGGEGACSRRRNSPG